MKRVVFDEAARLALRKHANFAPGLREKIAAYAVDPGSLVNMVTEFPGSSSKRLRVGDFRILFEETDTEILVSKIAPCGSVCDSKVEG